MARSRRSHPLLVPLALTVTAFAATAGLWFLSDKGSPSRDYSYESGLSSDEDPRQSSSRRRRARLGDLRDRRRGREHDRITEEDTEDLEEERRREESLRRGRGERERVRGELTMSPEATAVMGATSVMDLPDAPTPPHPGSFPVDVGPELTEVPPVPEGRYIPPPPPKRKVAIVLSERRALTGHDSDEDFEEAGLPSSLLQHLPSPLNLAQTDLFILIHSPHLPSHPLSNTPPPRHQTSYGFPSTGSDAGGSGNSTYDLACQLPIPREHIMPYNARASMAPILRQLSPEVVYVEEGLVEERDGAVVGELLEGGWVRDVVVVVRLGGGMEALMSDDGREEREKWWGRKGGVRGRFGRRCDVVEALVLSEDWSRRVEER